jgi:hypothetical protein
MHYTWQVFGDAEWSLRLPAFLFGVALIPAVYAAARSLYTPAAGLLAAALAAGSTPFIEYSANARGYGATWLALALMIPLTVRLMRGPDPAAWVLWTMLAIVGVFAVPTMGMSLIVLVIWLGLEYVMSGRFLRIAELAAASVVVVGWSAFLYRDTFGDAGWDLYDGIDPGAPTLGAAAIVVAVLVAAAIHLRRRVGPRPFPLLLVAAAVVSLIALELESARVVDMFEAVVRPSRGALAILAVVLTAAAVVLHRRIARTALSLPLVTVAVIPVFVLAGGLPFERPYERTWLWLTPIFLSAIAAGSVALARAWHLRVPPAAVPVAAVAVALLAAASTRASDPPWGEEVPFIGATDVTEWLKTTSLPDQLYVGPQGIGAPTWDHAADRTDTDRGRIAINWPDPKEGTIILLVNRAASETLGSELFKLRIVDRLLDPPEKVFEAGELELWRVALARS